MVKNTKILLCSIGLSIMLGGCSGMNNTKETQAEPFNDSLVSVQDYMGEGYALSYGKDTDKLAEKNKNQIEEAALKFFKDNYKTGCLCT